uniref:Gustatory receptor n=1 Tax=Lutzomyia longipalpis TaxID=7200 RepID=A0A240SXR0_LUTLO
MSETKKANFYRYSTCLYYFNKFFGLCAFHYNPSNRQFKESIPSIIYCLILLGFMSLYCPYLIIQFLFVIKDTFDSNLAIYIGLFQAILQLGSVVSVQYLNIYYRKEIIEYLNQKVIFEHKINKTVSKIYRNKYFLKKASSVILVFIFKLLSNYGIMFVVAQQGASVVIDLLCYLLPIGITTLTGCNFAMEIVSLQYITSQLNFALRELVDQINDVPKNTSSAQKMVLSCKICDKLDEFSILYSELNLNIAKLNKLETFTLLIYFCNKFIELTVSAFFEYLSYVGLLKTLITYEMIINGVINDIFNGLELIMCIAYCDKLMEEVATTGKILHEFPIHKVDDRLKESISQFSIQILQEKRSISLCGLFNVDNTLLYSMISSMTSYLILLIQFQLQGIAL